MSGLSDREVHEQIRGDKTGTKPRGAETWWWSSIL